MRLRIQHTSRYLYPQPALLGPHMIRLRPADHTKAHIESYGLHVSEECKTHWQQDPHGNRVARLSFRAGERASSLELTVEMAVDIKPVNPFDFFVDREAQKLPIPYSTELARSLLCYLDDRDDPAFQRGPRFEALRASIDPTTGNTVSFVVEVCRRVTLAAHYVIREESGVYTPEECLSAGRASCRDSAVLLIALYRSFGLAARFVSGYLVQVRDEGMLPGEPRGMDRDVVDLHAWAEVFLPGAGWVGLDGTSGLLCGEGHIPLACTPSPALASPIEGSADTAAESVEFETRVERLGHEVSPASPYEDATYEALLVASDRVEESLTQGGLTLTTGGEPTFNSRLHPDRPEWLGDALGTTKWTQGLELASALRVRMAPGAALVSRQGKHYPGEPLPRWALEIISRRDGRPAWPDFEGRRSGKLDDALAVASALAIRLGLDSTLEAAHEDPWRFLQEEALLPLDIDPLTSDLSDSDSRSRLARVLDRGLAEPAGFVLPLEHRDGRWRSSRWTFRRGHLFLLVGDSPIGLRLPLASLPATEPPPLPAEPELLRGDPRRDKEAAAKPKLDLVRTALCVEPRDGDIRIFLPPLEPAGAFFDLLEAIHAVREATGLQILLEGYAPASGPEVARFAVTPDPGVLEVNIPPSATLRPYADIVHTVFDAALETGLHAEKYLLDGRQQGSGGGNHITLGGPTLAESPFIKRPDLLASLLTFVQHHPSLSYLFTGLFVGPTSQAPRVDEARHDSLLELEIALRHAFDVEGDAAAAPWLGDTLFRHLLVDITGNGHRTEISIDKLCSPNTPYGRQGLVELRAFEMAPHPRLIVAQVALVRAIVAALAKAPYDRPLIRWGTRLHDRFLLPYFLERDLEDVLGFLDAADLPLPRAAYLPFVELRCPLVGRFALPDLVVEVRNALEPWYTLGEEAAGGGTARYVDSSVERIEVRVQGLVEGRHQVTVNGLGLPMVPIAADAAVAGVRFRAWAPPHSLHAHIGIHHPVRFEIVDTWAQRSLGACAYHVWHPEGRGFLAPPLTRSEAAARRAQRFTTSSGSGRATAEAPSLAPVHVAPAARHPDAPCTFDLRRFPIDRPVPEPEPPEVDDP